MLERVALLLLLVREDCQLVSGIRTSDMQDAPDMDGLGCREEKVKGKQNSVAKDVPSFTRSRIRDPREGPGFGRRSPFLSVARV